ncbi:myo-inositol-1-phosphate synthase [Streptococcus mutans]|nr:myo-inositol-1-phosphate synthase [Streptococcus mutans]
MTEIRVAIVGVGNCASNFVQGIEYYKNHPNSSIGLMNRKVGKYDIGDLKIVSAFDIDERKVGKDLSEAIFSQPNCTKKISEVPFKNVQVKMGPVMDGWTEHLGKYVKKSDYPKVDIKHELISNSVDVLVILLPTGSNDACRYYIETALKCGISVVNGIPVFLSKDEKIINLAKDNKAGIIGDDFKSQIGGTIFHHTLLNLLKIRGVEISNSYHINYAGNMDFWNLVTSRGNEKHKSKTNGVTSGIDDIDLSVNVTFLENQKDNKTCRVYIEGKNFGGCPVTVEGKLTVVDSANSSGVLVDAIRCLMIAKDKEIYGYLEDPSAYYMKSPRVQKDEMEAFKLVNEFIN